MPTTFDSPLGTQTISSGTRTLKNLEIPDETQSFEHPQPRQYQPINNQTLHDFQRQMQTQQQEAELAAAEMQFKKARQEKSSGIERLNEGAKKRIEMLIGMTRGNRTIKIENNEYTLQTLKSSEYRQAIMAAAEFDNTVQSPFEIRRQLLGRALVQIAGVEISHFVGSHLLEDKLVVIDQMDDILLNRLYDEYLLMTKEMRERYAIKNDTEAKEVVEDLKK